MKLSWYLLYTSITSDPVESPFALPTEPPSTTPVTAATVNVVTASACTTDCVKGCATWSVIIPPCMHRVHRVLLSLVLRVLLVNTTDNGSCTTLAKQRRMDASMSALICIVYLEFWFILVFICLILLLISYGRRLEKCGFHRADSSDGDYSPLDSNSSEDHEFIANNINTDDKIGQENNETIESENVVEPDVKVFWVAAINNFQKNENSKMWAIIYLLRALQHVAASDAHS
ncbi:hypothetical protein FQA39_LY03873 [Lamprigera yunnana]|nr:hypothetical protein FQA39_LY03873 [Lamprigera yunnana]